MGIYGVGIDLVRTDRVAQLLRRWGVRFEERVFTPRELETCRGKAREASCLAVRFAAKEAFVKALGTGIRPPVTWRDLEVANDSWGKPFLALSERAMAFCREHGVESWHLSLTDDGQYGAAIVILEC
jgi:holo-[acyl-carrier protein] synthase